MISTSLISYQLNSTHTLNGNLGKKSPCGSVSKSVGADLSALGPQWISRYPDEKVKKPDMIYSHPSAKLTNFLP
jgi:hypothetical protein